MLRYIQYKNLGENKQVDLLLTDGVYLGLVRYTSKSFIELYALGNFYVEVHFDRSTEEAMFLRPFSDLRHLDPYLDGISIEQLFELG